MQIRTQLRRMANTFAVDRPLTPEPNGYRGMHARIRHKSRAPHNRHGSGTAPRHTKKKAGR